MRHRAIAWLSAPFLLLALLTPLAPSSADAASTADCLINSNSPISGPLGTHVDVFGSMDQMLPTLTDMTGGGSSAELCQARGAIVSFQIAIGGAAAARTLNSVTPGALTGPGGTTIPAANVRIFREGYITLAKMSDPTYSDVIQRDANGICQGDCRFPDALIPAVDALTGGTRNPFNVSIPAGENRSAWVDVKVPSDATPGIYTGSVTVTVNTTPVAVPVKLTVMNATVPPKGSASADAAGTSIDSDFRMDTVDIQSKDWNNWARLAEIGLNNGIEVGWGDKNPPTAAQFDSIVKPLMDGTDPKLDWPGSRKREVVFNGFVSDIPEDRIIGSLDTWKSRLQGVDGEKTWFMCDEVQPAECNTQYAANIDAATGGWPGIPLLAIPYLRAESDPADFGAGAGLSTQPVAGPALKGLIPLSQTLQGVAGLSYWTHDPALSRMPAFNTWRGAVAGREVWSYTACNGGGCGDDYSAAVYRGWPSYGIDQFGTQQAAMGWQAFLFGWTGEHFWEFNRCQYNPVEACTYNVIKPTGQVEYGNGVNGDGSLVYLPSQFGVSGTDTPIETTRLKRIRDGRTMFALLKLATAVGQPSATRTAATNAAMALYPRMSESAPAPSDYYAGVQTILRLFDAGGSAGKPSIPLSVVVTPDDGAVTSTWSAPATNAASVTGYVAEAYPYGTTTDPVGRTCTSSAAAKACTITGLFNGGRYRVRVKATSAAGDSGLSAYSAAVIPRLPPFAVTTAPKVVGTPKYGQTLTANKGTWTGVWGLDDVTYAYKWFRDGVAIAGGTSATATYKAKATDVGKSLSVRVTASGPGYTPGIATSAGRLIGKASVAFSETAANTTKRTNGVVNGQSITLTFTLGTLANGGTVSARILNKSVGTATVSSGKAVIVVTTAGIPGLTVGTTDLKVSFAQTATVNAVTGSYSLRIT